MSVTEYTPVTFAPGDPLTIEKMNALANNMQLLYEKTPKTLYKAYGITKDKGIRVYSTVLTIPPIKAVQGWGTVYFGNFFSVGCKPVITLGVNAWPQHRYHTNFSGINQVLPDHRGVQVRIQADELNVKNNKVSKTVYVNVTAIGW